jgi:SAM-dependent methyltransferase
MEALVEEYAKNTKDKRVLDVGSCDVNKEKVSWSNYRSIFKGRYEGLDVAPGPNVDIVIQDHYRWDIPDKTYDIVISGQCLEHVEAPWLTMKEIERVCKDLVIIIAPWKWRIHGYPIDCWRILPDGMRYLLEGYCHFKVLEVDTACNSSQEGLCYGVGQL